GERKGVNKYYPPDFDPAKHGSLNKYRHSHPLRERARKLSQGILIIRFEMPYNIWCDGCKNHIGMGVRYNAEKKKVGNYYTTPIYRWEEKKILQEEEKKDLALQSKASLSIPLVRESEEDRHLATLLKYQSLGSYEDKQKQKRSAIAERPWFSVPQASGTKANDTLRKLGLSAKSPAGKSPLNLTHLGVVRRKSRDRPGASTEEEEEEVAAAAPLAQENRLGRDGVAESASLGAPAQTDLVSQTADEKPPCDSAASLVADYSDSSSDAEL
ncbi:PREDICTED: coiled-coil domain-containing protein 130, partial [Gekko japonicus]|uniref:Probable splicing factor YJU2B n=1 Tax=Gekko japonicus TaxID=146911 RepID=A0ABM1KEL3_GEKJA